ncbi:TetR/AcrR family transcriptional regulator [Neptunomonas sp.]|uniref:TetR/AcrR family transcriptional regulator n=1 Tax=Neptunomonas sp. TaxID=1971898 RepID=UPI0025D6453A|nr:TetR/AcrR family transcriptional regulator [Neptunomonas sp.]
MSSKRLQLISTAFSLFYQKGVHAVGINEILAESGVAKKTLYHHFTGKEELVLAVLVYRDQCFCDWLKERLDSADSGMAKVEALFDALDDWFNDRVEALFAFHGCFFINVSAEFGDLTHPLHQQCAKHKQSVACIIESLVRTTHVDVSRISTATDALCLLKEGAITLAHVQGDRKAAIKAKETAKLLIRSL